MSVYANFSPNEGTVAATPVTITFPWRARRIIITNDSATESLEYKFNASENYGTLKPTETISLYHNSNTVRLDSPSNNSVAYRVWGYG